MSRISLKTTRSVIHLIQRNKKLWEEADIIPKIRDGKVVEEVKNKDEL